MQILCFALAVFTVAAAAADGKKYQWIDADGNIHLSDHPTEQQAPEAKPRALFSRNQAKLLVFASGIGSTAPAVSRSSAWRTAPAAWKG
jgi:hypothetical protein